MNNFQKWRLVMKGGEDFVEAFITRYSRRETEEEFTLRKEITSCVPVTKNCLIKNRNAIFQRIQAVQRIGGPVSYGEQIVGNLGGVDGKSSKMLNFIGLEVLTELLTMAQAGILITRRGSVLPYYTSKNPPLTLEIVKRETIEETVFERGILVKLVLNTEKTKITYALQNGKVFKETFYKPEGEDDKGRTVTVGLDLSVIPFVLGDIGESLLQDTADMQITATSLDSSDNSFLYRSNFPIYTEQTGKSQAVVKAMPMEGEEKPRDKEVSVGVDTGRLYPVGAERPGFISPPTDPVELSMKKQEQIEKRVMSIMDMTLSSIGIKANAESDSGSKEEGISAICLELERIENEIAVIWGVYEGREPATVNYPEKYSLKTDQEIREEAKELREILCKMPSLTGQKEIAKIIATNVLERKVSKDVLDKIHEEIEASKIVVADPDILRQDVERGYLSGKLAAEARNYPADDYDLAKEEQLDRIKATAVAQSSGTRGVEDTNDLDQDKADKKDKDKRGKGKNKTGGKE